MPTKSYAKPFFSIIIPTLNEEAYLPSLLKDLTKQTYKDVEIIVCDGGSTDKTQVLATKVPNVTFLACTRKNVSYQRNLGSKNAHGQYLLFMDADTRIPPYFLEGLKYQLSVHPSDIFTTWLRPDSDKAADKVVCSFMNLLLETNRLVETPIAYGAMMGCKRNVFLKVAGFDPKITFAEDTEIIRRGITLGFSYKLYKDPQFTFSLRRFRREGTLPMLRKYASLNLRILLAGFPKDNQKDYPMLGGAYYVDQKKSSKLMSSIEKTVAKLRRLRNRDQLQKFLETFFLGER